MIMGSAPGAATMVNIALVKLPVNVSVVVLIYPIPFIGLPVESS